MKRFLIVLALIAAGVVAFGFYRGWFGVASNSSDNKSHINLTVDEGKIREDEKNALERVHNLGHPTKDKAAVSTEKNE